MCRKIKQSARRESSPPEGARDERGQARVSREGATNLRIGCAPVCIGAASAGVESATTRSSARLKCSVHAASGVGSPLVSVKVSAGVAYTEYLGKEGEEVFCINESNAGPGWRRT